MVRQKIRQLTLRAWSLTFFTLLLVVILLSWISYSFIQPFPPKTLTMATGMTGGSYALYGELYRQVLARDGIQVILRSSSGAVENMNLLKDRSQTVEAAFVQGTVGKIDESSNLVSLGGIAYTPLWVFYRGKNIYDDLTQLNEKKVAIGPEGSGVKKYAIDLLKVAKVTSPPTEFLNLPYSTANQALLEGKVDAIMTFGSPDNQLILELLNAKDIKLMNISQAEAYARRFPDLSHVVLPKGTIDPAKWNPPTDVHLLSPTTNLIVRKEMHPALIYLLLKASVEIHSGSTWVNKAGDFPSLSKQDDPISEQAQRFYKSGGSWLYAYLPFWIAALVERLTFILIPLGMIIVPLIGIAPWIYTWKNRSKYYPLYHDLRNLEKEILENKSIEKFEAYESRLDRIEDAVSHIHTSIAFYDELFILKEHIQIVRLRLNALFPNSNVKRNNSERTSTCE